VQPMLDRGLTEQAAADVLGWSISRVVARVKILQLPEWAQQIIGAGEIPLSAVDQLLSIAPVAPALPHPVISYLDEGNQWATEQLASKPGWVVDSAIREGRGEDVRLVLGLRLFLQDLLAASGQEDPETVQVAGEGHR
jgi:hypothetical protein